MIKFTYLLLIYARHLKSSLALYLYDEPFLEKTLC